MSDINLFMILLTAGIISNLFLNTLWNWISLAVTGKWHSHISMPGLNNRGETTTTDEIKFDEKQQAHVDKIVQSRIAREREKFADYEDLRKFKTEYEKSQEQKSQEELIRQKKYEEAENTYKTKINEFGQKLTAKEQEIQNLRIDYALTNEISRANGYVEESLALLKNQIAVDANGNMSIKGKDANGIDINMPLVDGIKKFYEQRPHLLKSTHKQGSGTGSGSNGGGTGEGAGSNQLEDLNYLNAELIKARGAGDGKKISEIQLKIKTALKSKGVSV